uniref:Rho GTPase-activating protein 17 n=1 Tax=Phallusia mammillata TaxID=59560 RepID=A0A6F9D5Y7_9ASCI|nr:rho GTPase-activating protein 17 [Phallusia mammillata]
MKKQLMRYKLIADQKVGRANKSEVLNDELLQVEKHMEHVRVACQTLYKKLSPCLQTHNSGDFEKRLKRLHETSLAMAMSEASKQLVQDTDTSQTLGESFRICADTQMEMAKEKAMCEMFIDDHVILPLQNLVETEIPSLYKLRERLRKLVLDRDGANQNYNKAYKLQFNPGVNLQQTTAKADALKEELDQATQRMEQSKDQLIAEMFEFVAKEAGHGERISDFHAKQLEYHRRCVAILEKNEAELKNVQAQSVVKSCYGRSLHDHLQGSKREIALPLEACALCILALGAKEEGIFRIGGGAGKLKKFRALVDGGVLDLAEYEAQDDIHAVAGALKQYLRELPEPLLTHKLHDEWLHAASIQNNDDKLQEIWTIIDKLPEENKANFRYLIKFCAVIAEHQELNKMSPLNISLVLTPNLLWSHIDDISKRMMESNLLSGVIEAIITYSDWFFPGEMEFAVTPNAPSYHHMTRSDSGANGASLHANHLTPAPTSPTAKSPSHSRNSSTDLTLAQEAGFVPIPGQSPAGGGKGRKHKSKAPPPPAETKSNERNSGKRNSPPPPAQQQPNSLMPSSNVVGSRPPVAAKRVSMRRPQAPPPMPPKEDTPEGEPAAPQDGVTVPRPKPRPPVRKRTSGPAVDEVLPEAPENEVQGAVGVDHDPPMPDLPPPPLPDEFDAMGGPLMSELQYAQNNTAYEDSDNDDQTTPL